MKSRAIVTILLLSLFLFPALVHAQTLIKNPSFPAQDYNGAASDGNGLLYTATTDSSNVPTVIKMNAATGAVISNWTDVGLADPYLFTAPSGVYSFGSAIYLPVYWYNDAIFGQQGMILKISPSAMTIQANFTVTNLGQITNLCSDGSYIYFLTDTKLYKVDMNLGLVSSTDFTPSYPAKLLYYSNSLYVTFNNGTLIAVNSSTLAAGITANFGANSLADLAFQGNDVYAHSAGSSVTMREIILTNFSVVTYWALSTGDSNIVFAGMTFLGGNLYIANLWEGGSGARTLLTVFDPGSMTALATLQSAINETPLYMLTDGSNIFLATVIDSTDYLSTINYTPAPTPTSTTTYSPPGGGGTNENPSPSPSILTPAPSPSNSGSLNGWSSVPVIGGAVSSIGSFWNNLSSIGRGFVTALLFMMFVVLVAAAMKRKNIPVTKRTQS